MKLGIIFKPVFHYKYGHKQEFFGDRISIERVEYELIINMEKYGNNKILLGQESFPVEAIQLIYLGEWK